MKVAVFSDIHGNLEALKAIIDDIKMYDFDEVICLGDVVDIGPSSKECLDLIMQNNIKMILGNHELYCINDLSKYREVSKGELNHINWVKSTLTSEHYSFLKKQDIVYNIDDIIFMHFPYNYDMDDFFSPNLIYGNNAKSIFSKYDGKTFIFGHEHKKLDLMMEDKHYYCVGSSGCTKGSKTHYTVLDIGKFPRIYNVEVTYDRALFEQKLRNIDYPEKQFLAYNFFNCIV